MSSSWTLTNARRRSKSTSSKMGRLPRLTAERIWPRAGMGVATVNGKKELIDLKIDESLFTPDDKDMLKDLIIAAVNKALIDVDVLAKEEIKKSTEGMMPNIPGFDLSSML